MLDLSRFPRTRLLEGATPIQELTRLNATLGGVRLFVKRDDLTGIGGGGNKLRKLEFLIGEAKAQGADTILTVGARQSNHARLTAASAAHVGLNCELVLPHLVPRNDDDYLNNGNVLLDGLFGATVHHLDKSADVVAFVGERLAALTGAGHKVYFAPTGGSNAVGCLGYADCASEIAEQSAAMGVTFAQVVTPNGSAGTHAGLVAGFAAMGRDPKIVKSYAVYYTGDKTRDVTLPIANETLARLQPGVKLSNDDILVDGAHRGEGYGIPTEEMQAAVREMARTQGLLLDPVYSGKAFGALLHDIRNGAYRRGDAVLFVMTGGVPGLYAYRSAFAG